MKNHFGACISKPEIIALAACPVCCAMRGERCTFPRSEDPHGHRYAAYQSHLPRMQKARKIAARPLDIPAFSL